MMPAQPASNGHCEFIYTRKTHDEALDVSSNTESFRCFRGPLGNAHSGDRDPGGLPLLVDQDTRPDSCHNTKKVLETEQRECGLLTHLLCAPPPGTPDVPPGWVGSPGLMVGAGGSVPCADPFFCSHPSMYVVLVL